MFASPEIETENRCWMLKETEGCRLPDKIKVQKGYKRCVR